MEQPTDKGKERVIWSSDDEEKQPKNKEIKYFSPYEDDAKFLEELYSGKKEITERGSCSTSKSSFMKVELDEVDIDIFQNFDFQGVHDIPQKPAKKITLKHRVKEMEKKVANIEKHVVSMNRKLDRIMEALIMPSSM